MSTRKAKVPDAGPLIAAVNAMLPAAGTAWPVDARRQWLKMMAQALTVTYGGDVGADVEVEKRSAPTTTVAPAAPVYVPPPKPSAAEAVPAARAQGFAFYIDRDGYVRNKQGDRVMPSQVTDIIHDLRGDADPGSISWADDSMGITGVDVAISAVFQ